MRRDRCGECEQRYAERLLYPSARRALTQSGPLPQRPRFVAVCLFVTDDEFFARWDCFSEIARTRLRAGL